METQAQLTPKRETDGKYAHQGNWDRLCVCGHTLGVHASGSPADCLLHSLSSDDLVPGSEVMQKQLSKEVDCGCTKFRLSRTQLTPKEEELQPSKEIQGEAEQRFEISKHANGYYQVSIPRYHGGEVVTAESFDSLKAERDAAIEALRGVAIMLSTQLEEYEPEPWAQRVRAALRSGEGETK